jgi:4-amino-4-deoxy-L-arabinose transferase-like glycosyltransferase
MVAVMVLFNAFILPTTYIILGFIEAVGFFYFANLQTIRWGQTAEKSFLRHIFFLALVLRIIYVVFNYFFMIYETGIPFEHAAADVLFYDSAARLGADQIAAGNYRLYDFFGVPLSDSGEVTYLSYVYAIFGKSIMFARLLKALWSALTCVLIYKLAKRNFGEQVARMATLFCVFMPNLIYYTGTHLKETEMTFLMVLFVERLDDLLRNRKFKILNMLVPVLVVAVLFTYRTAVGITAIMSFFTTLVFSTKRVMNFGRRMILIVWVASVVVFFWGGQIQMEVEGLWEGRLTNQSVSMQDRATMKGGNKFVENLSAAVFVPLIFVIPFPTVVNIEMQHFQMMINGGNFVKNLMAFFVLLALYHLVKTGKWRDYTLIGSFMLFYLIIIAFSKFAAVERFHLPIIPFFMTFAAYGVSLITNKTKKYYNIYIVLLFVAIIGWSWFKLGGRGLI